MKMLKRELKNKKGQSLVEFAIILPLLLLVIMAIIEFGVMLNSYLTIHNAAREGARAGIAGSSSTEIQNLIISVSPGLDVKDLIINISPVDKSRKPGDALTVQIRYNYHLTVPVISRVFVNNVVILSAQVSMRIE
ncbi:MAG TPA: pilus assembly protein [Clostridiales bacterium]|nr:pilus assembly protein [Clostridiales bacterium]